MLLWMRSITHLSMKKMYILGIVLFAFMSFSVNAAELSDIEGHEYEYAIQLVDLESCNGNGGCDTEDLVRTTRAASVGCIDDRVTSGLDVWDCLIATDVSFDTSGMFLYYSFFYF